MNYRYITNTVMYLCWVSTLFGMICYLSSKCNKTSITWFRSECNILHALRMFRVLRYPYLSQCNEAWHWEAFYRKGKMRHLWELISLSHLLRRKQIKRHCWGEGVGNQQKILPLLICPFPPACNAEDASRHTNLMQNLIIITILMCCEIK